jgi:acetyl-CoA carboxylase biotin carboxyl carrier protein
MSETNRQVQEPAESASSSHPLTPAAAVATVREMIDMMASGGVKELDVQFGDVAIRLRSKGKNGQVSVPAPTPPSEPVLTIPTGETEHTVTAPMIGTFYVASSPQDPAFVQVGDEVATGQVIGIIEAMKIMNEIVSDADGKVTSVVAENGQAVEYGSPLIRMSPPETTAG